jgi:threonine/homoserine/homoserine lactone efflux protein
VTSVYADTRLMETNVIGIAGMVALAALTPGPNNLIVMQAAARAGCAAALPAIAGVVLGSLVLLAVALAGANVLFAEHTALRTLVAVGGSVYLGGLGARLLIARPGRGGSINEAPVLSRLLLFQFLNPKSWVLAVTAAAVAKMGFLRAIVEIGALFVLIPTACLLLWSSLGVLLTSQLSDERVRRRFDQTMGLLLIGSALLMLRSS